MTMEKPAESALTDKVRTESESSDGTYDSTSVFPPLVDLPEVPIVTNEENEEEMLKIRARLYRFGTKGEETPEWIERGTGELKLLRHLQNNTVRVVMRRDKTFKVCANHFITPFMELKPCVGSDKAFFYFAFGDYAFEELKSECFAVKFRTVEAANQFKEKFNEAKKIVKESCTLYADDSVNYFGLDDKSLTEDVKEDKDELTKKMNELVVEEVGEK